MMVNEHWYELKVRPGFEIIVAQGLRKLNLEAFVPERKRIHSPKSPDRRPPTGYVYCRFALKDWQSLTSIPGVLDVLGSPKPVPVDAVVSALRSAAGSR
jgi:hypothetical protein